MLFKKFPVSFNLELFLLLYLVNVLIGMHFSALCKFCPGSLWPLASQLPRLVDDSTGRFQLWARSIEQASRQPVTNRRPVPNGTHLGDQPVTDRRPESARPPDAGASTDF